MGCRGRGDGERCRGRGIGGEVMVEGCRGRGNGGGVWGVREGVGGEV